MAVEDEHGGPARYHEDPEVGWRDRVVFADEGRGQFAYRPNDVLTTVKGADEARRIAMERWPDALMPIDVVDRVDLTARLGNVPDPLMLVAELRMRGEIAHLNHVLFIHCGCCPPHPASAVYGGLSVNPATINPATINPATINPATINPATINPATINPATINPATINPATINPATINPYHPARVTGLRRSSALPAAPSRREAEAIVQRIQADARPGAPRVVVLDTGLPLPGEAEPEVLRNAPQIHAARGADIDEPDNDQNGHLDPAAGHGAFIAGIVNQVAPGCTVTVDRVATMYGDTDEFTAAKLISEVPSDDRTILSLSFGGYAMDDDAIALAWAIRKFQSGGGVVVASAGNDSSCQPTFPAALPKVVSVGAIGPSGPALFTNYGPWVRACAPGVNLTSTFFNFRGVGRAGGEGIDPDNFYEWARWSGTSFSAPVVVGALGRMMMWSGCTAAEAVERVVDAPELMRIPGLGTVVNVI